MVRRFDVTATLQHDDRFTAGSTPQPRQETAGILDAFGVKQDTFSLLIDDQIIQDIAGGDTGRLFQRDDGGKADTGGYCPVGDGAADRTGMGNQCDIAGTDLATIQGCANPDVGARKTVTVRPPHADTTALRNFGQVVDELAPQKTFTIIQVRQHDDGIDTYIAAALELFGNHGIRRHDDRQIHPTGHLIDGGETAVGKQAALPWVHQPDLALEFFLQSFEQAHIHRITALTGTDDGDGLGIEKVSEIMLFHHGRSPVAGHEQCSLYATDVNST